ncbi:MAG: DUF1826 domain-containing protein [Pseudomonadota bacterium]
MAQSPAALRQFLKPDCAVALWARGMPSDVSTWLDTLDPDRLPRGRMVLPVHGVGDTVAQLCDAHDLPGGPERDWLQSDIAALAEVFCDLMDVRFLRFRLDVIETNACRKFHIDAIRARLLCTYRGTGTQLGYAQPGHDPDAVMTIATGSPLLLRGSLWPADPAPGLLHRSPPIEGTGETRLVLVLDPVFDEDLLA